MAVTDTQLYLAIGLPIFAIILSFIGGTMHYSAIMSRFSSLENQVTGRFASLDNQMNSRFAGVENRLSSIESRFDTLTGKVIEIDNCLTRVEAILERR